MSGHFCMFCAISRTAVISGRILGFVPDAEVQRPSRVIARIWCCDDFTFMIRTRITVNPCRCLRFLGNRKDGNGRFCAEAHSVINPGRGRQEPPSQCCIRIGKGPADDIDRIGIGHTGEGRAGIDRAHPVRQPDRHRRRILRLLYLRHRRLAGAGTAVLSVELRVLCAACCRPTPASASLSLPGRSVRSSSAISATASA